MSNFLFYFGAFALALGLLIVVHEAGHFALARLCGVKVLRFSIGFGKPLLSRSFGRDRTELALSAFPLGGYVKMLDEREGEVSPAELDRAFNRQSVWKRFAIVLAGPVANFALAVLLYWILFVHGVEEPRPVLGKPAAHSAAERAGFQEEERVLGIDGKPIETWQELRWELLQRVFSKGNVNVEVINPRNEITIRRLDLAAIRTDDLEGDLMSQLGFRYFRPRLPPLIGKVEPGGVADRAGLREGDRIGSIDGRATDSWAQVVAIIREAPGRLLRVSLERNGQAMMIELIPQEVEDRGKPVGRIGIAVREEGVDRSALMTTVRYGVVEAFGKALGQTWETSAFSLSMLGKMVLGEVSWKNLSGPVTIADYAGQSARLGPVHYIKFLALISISLGVLNLLPIPLLDGGHLMYYIVEIIKGGPVSERVMEIGQQIGLGLLALLMAFAFYNDINRLVSG